MDTVLALLLNIVYGFLFFLAFGVMFATVAFFALAFWDKVGRRLFRRRPRANGSFHNDSPSSRMRT